MRTVCTSSYLCPFSCRALFLESSPSTTIPDIATHTVKLLNCRQGVTSSRKLPLDPKLGLGVPSCRFHTTQTIQDDGLQLCVEVFLSPIGL